MNKYIDKAKKEDAKMKLILSLFGFKNTTLVHMGRERMRLNLPNKKHISVLTKTNYRGDVYASYFSVYASKSILNKPLKIPTVTLLKEKISCLITQQNS